MNLDTTPIGSEQKYFALWPNAPKVRVNIFHPCMRIFGTGQSDLARVLASGIGAVYTTSVLRQRPDKGAVYNVELTHLEEGS
jgi:hypothetical protein